MRPLPPPKPFHHDWREGQFVEALRRPAGEPSWNLAHEALCVEEQLPFFAINEDVWQHVDRTGETVFYYEVPFVLPILNGDRAIRYARLGDYAEFEWDGW